RRLVAGDALRGGGHEGAQRRRVGPAAQLLEHGPSLGLQLAQEAPRGLQVVAPARALPRAQVRLQRLGPRPRGSQPAPLPLGGLARRLELAPARLEALGGACHVAALARGQPPRGLERAGGYAVAAGDREREAVADG